MEGKEAIINRIIGDAEKKANEIIEAAEKYSDERRKEAEIWAEEYSKAQNAALERELKDVVERRAVVAALDARKNALKSKRDVIEKVRSLAFVKLCALKKNEYLAFVERLINENADDGDLVILSSDGKLCSEDVKALPVFKQKSLKVGKEKGDFIGGVKLQGKICDKDLSFETVVAEKTIELTGEIAAELFKEE